MNMSYEMFLTMLPMYLTCRKDRVKHLQEKKDETCFEEQVMTVQDSL